MEVPQNFVQTWACIRFSIDPIAITCWINLGVASNFCANIACIRFSIDPIAIKCWINLGVASNFCANIRFFLILYTWFSNIVNDSATLHRLINENEFRKFCEFLNQNSSPFFIQTAWLVGKFVKKVSQKLLDIWFRKCLKKYCKWNF